MGLHQLAGPYALPVAFVIVIAAALSSIFISLFGRPRLPKNAPQMTSDQWPIIGSLGFFNRRWDFVRESASKTNTHNFTFFAGQYPIVALTGEPSRKLFFEHRGLDFTEGYAALLGGGLPPQKDVTNEETDFGGYFQKRLIAMLKGPVLKAGLPQMLKDVRDNLDLVAQDPSRTTDPFHSIYRIVFQLTMRAVACHEIADDPAVLAACLNHFEAIESTATPLTIMYPWMPLPAKFRRLKSGAQLYMIFKKVIDARKTEGRTEKDALQFLLDQGDDVRYIITFVLGALFAGQLNSGINAAYILCYLACNEDWRARVRAEVNSVAEKYLPADVPADTPLKEKLMHVPIEAWEGEFPAIDLALKDTIRMHMPGTAFRKNTSGQDIPIPGSKQGEVIPANAFVAFPVGDMFYNQSIYTAEHDWDPARYLPERAEDKKQAHAWMGWGAGRHPCLGMRFAKLENNLITAFWLAYFDEWELRDGKSGAKMDRVYPANRNEHSASKPQRQMVLAF